MPRKTPEEHFEDYVDSAVISVVTPLLFAAPYQAFQNVPIERLELASKIPLALIILIFFVLFISGLAGSILRGKIFGGIGYIIGSYGANLLVTDPIPSILLMGFGALVTYIGTSTRTRDDFQKDSAHALRKFGV